MIWHHTQAARHTLFVVVEGHRFVKCPFTLKYVVVGSKTAELCRDSGNCYVTQVD